MLKKLLAIVFCLLLCVGCGGKTAVQSTDIAFQFPFSSGGEEFFVEAEINSEGDAEFIVSKIASKAKLYLEFEDDTVHTEFLGIKQDMPRDTTDFGLIGHIYTAFSGLHNTEAERQGDEYIATVIVGDNKYIFTVTDLGLPIGLSINGEKIEFNNIKAT